MPQPGGQPHAAACGGIASVCSCARLRTAANRPVAAGDWNTSLPASSCEAPRLRGLWHKRLRAHTQPEPHQACAALRPSITVCTTSTRTKARRTATASTFGISGCLRLSRPPYLAFSSASCSRSMSAGVLAWGLLRKAGAGARGGSAAGVRSVECAAAGGKRARARARSAAWRDAPAAARPRACVASAVTGWPALPRAACAEQHGGPAANARPLGASAQRRSAHRRAGAVRTALRPRTPPATAPDRSPSRSCGRESSSGCSQLAGSWRKCLGAGAGLSASGSSLYGEHQGATQLCEHWRRPELSKAEAHRQLGGERAGASIPRCSVGHTSSRGMLPLNPVAPKAAVATPVI